MILQHQDVNVGPAAYKDLKPDELLVTSIFETIQGEGPYAGQPAIFLRLAGCNRGRKADMGCAFCDTHFVFSLGKRMTFVEIVQEFSKYDVPRLIVITGGEPMLQNNLTEFVKELLEHDRGIEKLRTIQIESNGDRLAEGFAEIDGDVTLVVSPKVIREYKSLRSEVYERADALKFLICADPKSPYYDVPPYAEQFRNGAWSQGLVYVSPMTEYSAAHNPRDPVSGWNTDMIDVQRTQANYKRAVELCLRYGFHMNMQQHLFYGVE
jgi:7-carboxy-7-deazaguanine synthase